MRPLDTLTHLTRATRVSTLAFVALALVAAMPLTGCTKKVTRVQTDEVIDLSGKWNDSDSRFVAEAMIQQCMSAGWLGEHVGGKPVVTVGAVRNKSNEHINTQTFTNDLRNAMINSGRIKVIADKEQRQEIRQEREEQAVYASESTQKAPGQEIGADYMLKGTINTIEDREGSERVIFYQIDMELISVADNSISWTGQKKIKKFIERETVRY